MLFVVEVRENVSPAIRSCKDNRRVPNSAGRHGCDSTDRTRCASRTRWGRDFGRIITCNARGRCSNKNHSGGYRGCSDDVQILGLSDIGIG